MPRWEAPPPRERLIAAGSQLFYERGYGVTLDAVAEAASVAKPTVYAHFDSKVGLIEAILQSASDEFFSDLDTELERRAGDPLERLLAPFDLLMADLPDPAYHGCLCLNAAATFPASDHPARRVFAAMEERLLRVFQQLAKDAGADEPRPTARQLLLLFDGTKARGLSEASEAVGRDARAAATALVRG